MSRKDIIEPAFETLAIQDAKRKTGSAKVTIPAESSVDEAKAWVDENEK